MSHSLQTTLSQLQDEHFRNSDNIRIKVPKYHITRFYGDDASKREKISDLWEFDSLGIKDPSEKKSKLELQDLALKHYENTVLRDDEGRYIVSIPWIEGNEKLQDHYSLAKGRLEKTVKSLKFTGRLFDYEQVFVDWEKEGIIENIAQDEPKSGGKFHYLPHKPIFKENSMTKIRPVFDGSADHVT
ncbi:uncharacterized protein TNIN_201541 [Trichonephila inaurata madagascariensis]|uniref:Uncharacterized protein n=1 Tax=Trichonephila inaurata madagascariensis TaxID=2747483 RepID=A0A8X7C2Z2_9ARAC|nr:uncharacterized protein TNIN_201541 [Trichonephila inaurata madagascariensis]